MPCLYLMRFAVKYNSPEDHTLPGTKPKIIPEQHPGPVQAFLLALQSTYSIKSHIDHSAIQAQLEPGQWLDASHPATCW